MSTLDISINVADQREVDMVFTGDDGIKESGRVSYDDFLEIVNDKEIYKEESIRIPKLPEGAVDIKWSDAKNYSLVILVPGDRRYASFCNEKCYLPYPNLVFKFRVKNGKVQGGSAVMACNDDYHHFGPKTELFNYPYGNVSAGSGSICWGGNALPKVKEPYELTALMELFFSANTNLDLWQAGKNAKAKSLKNFVRQQSKRKTFDTAKLVSAGTFEKWNKS